MNAWADAILHGGKLIADSITLGQNSQLRLVIPGGGFKKGESTGYLKLIESDSWSGDWNKVFANNLMFDIDYNDGLILRRTLATDGKSRAWINDVPVSVKTLKQVGDALVEIHGQFANHALLNQATHRAR